MPLGCKTLLQGHTSKRGNFVLNKVLISKILVFRKENDPSYCFIVIIIYLLKAGEFFFLVDTLNPGFQGGDKDRTIGIVTCLLVVEAKTLLNANLLFLWGELPDMYGMYVHNIWILGFPNKGRGKVRAYRRRGGLVVFGLSRHNLIGSVPLGLEPFCLGLLFINGGRYGVH